MIECIVALKLVALKLLALTQAIANHGACMENLRARWPARVMIVGWATQPKGVSPHENPTDIVNDINEQCVYHNLVQMMPRDPGIGLRLDSTVRWKLHWSLLTASASLV